jgi:alkylation response protein AidB-like acyl-CoA dehydrogenase
MSEQPQASADFYRIDDLLTDVEREVRDRVRAFCDKEVTPIINDYWERAEFPFELVPSWPPCTWPAAPSRATAARGSARWPPAWSAWSSAGGTAASAPSSGSTPAWP